MKTTAKMMLSALFAMGAGSMFAQTPEMLEIMCANGMNAGTNNSLYNDYFPKGGQAKPLEAYDTWKALYDAVPNFNLNLYLNGEKILVAKVQDAQKNKDAAAQQKYAKELEKLMDDRIANGFATATVPAEAIQAKKVDYFAKYDSEANDETVYQMYCNVVNSPKLETLLDSGSFQPYYIAQWCSTSMKLAKKNSSLKNTYVADYMKSTEYLDKALDGYYQRYDKDTTLIALGQADAKIVKDTTTVKKLLKDARDRKTVLTQLFATSGFADVQTLVDIFTPQVEEKKSDLAFLNNVAKLLARSKEGRETDLYTQVADYSYQIQPSLQAAKGLATRALRNKDYGRALDYYEEAYKLAIQPDDKTDILNLEAVTYQLQHNFSKARDLYRRSLSIDPSQDDPHAQIAGMYASSPIGDKASTRALVYVAAYNEMQQAIANASSPEKKAKYQGTAGSYRAAFPERGTLFMEAGLQPGSSYTIGGWIGVTVSVQCK